MTQEEEELLLKDLCGRLPYGVKVWYKYSTWYSEKFATSIRLADEKIALSSKFNKEGDWFSVEEAGEILIKPYLRPMSSMTEEEREEFRLLGGIISYNPNHNTYSMSAFSPEAYDWLNKKMIDYRGLIPKGLALEAKEGLYNN